MSSTPRRPVKAQLLGGLGNQLFVYFAARYASEKSKRPLSLFYSPSTNRHSSDIRRFMDFDFEPTHISPLISRAIGLLPRHSKSPLLARVSHELFRAHKSESVGVDLCIDCIFKRGGYLQGYFQTFEYFDELGGKATFDFTLRHPSKRFTHNLSQVSDRIAVHIRRGDYLDPVNRYIGALSIDYFVSAVDASRAQLGRKESVMVFTDDPQSVRTELLSAGVSGWEVFEADSDITAEEEMILMSQAKSLVISNSSFSWWAANVGSDKFVVAPHKWFRSGSDPHKLLRDDWLVTPSSWI